MEGIALAVLLSVVCAVAAVALVKVVFAWFCYELLKPLSAQEQWKRLWKRARQTKQRSLFVAPVVYQPGPMVSAGSWNTELRENRRLIDD